MPRCPQGLSPGFAGLQGNRPRAICHIIIDFGRTAGRSVGTGFLESTGPNVSYVLTAGHNIFSPRHRVWAKRLELYFGRVGSQIYYPVRISRNIRRYAIVNRQFSSPGYRPDLDFGMIRIPHVIEGIEPIRAAASRFSSSIDLRIFGYPNAGRCNRRFLPFHSDLRAVASGSQNFKYEQQATYSGMSGGPLIRGQRQTHSITCRGLHIRSSQFEERALRFTSQNLNVIQAWKTARRWA